MQPATERNLQVIFDAHEFALTPAEEQMLHADLEGLSRQVQHFPLADLRVLIEGNRRSNEVSVKLTLILPGNTLVTNDHDAVLSAAFHRCLDSLLDCLHEYKGQLGQVPERQKAEEGTRQELHATVPIDAAAVDSAVTIGDYIAFRTATFPLEEGLRKRIGRWVQRYPEFEARIGKDLEIADVVEEVFLIAFESYDHRPPDIPFGTWLEDLIDTAIKALQNNTDEELENVSLARTARAAEQGPAMD
jgi:ribosome-associated translation inhibitor RaiA